MTALALDARRTYDLWLALVQDEELYRATLAGRHGELAGSRQLSQNDLVILDEFRKEPGFRWNVENLRFRAAGHVVGRLLLNMQRTIYLLTRGDEDWMQELAFEYLAQHQWRELGHDQLAECERFGAYVRERVLRRRIPPPHIETVLDFELAVVRHVRSLASLPADAWPRRAKLADAELANARPRLSRSATLLEVPVDITEWIRSADPRTGTVKDEPIAVLVVVASPQDAYRYQRISAAVRPVLDRCDGSATTAEIVSALESSYEPDELYALIGRWIENGTLST